MSSIAVIPARGGSKRIPGKNIRRFAGKPIIGWSIEAAAASGLFERIVVSTDSEEVAEVARAFGAEVPFRRPPELSDDFVGTMDVMQHAVTLLARDAPHVRHACCLYATAPFIRAEDLREGLARLRARGCDYAFSVAAFEFPIQRAIRVGEGSRVTPFFPEHIRSRSQDLEPAYHDAGQFYWGTVDAFSAGRPLYTPSSLGIVLPRSRVRDIDTEEDWVEAERMFLGSAVACP